MESNDKNYVVILVLVVLITVGLLLSGNKDGKSNQVPESTSSVEQNTLETPQTPPVKAQKQDVKGETVMAKSYSSAPSMQLEKGKDYKVELVTNKGSIKIDLFEEKVPVTVNNFVFLAKDGFYDGTMFHRIIKDFMIQGGDPRGDGTGGPGYKFADEDFDGSYDKGVVAMANSGPNTNGSQFFIMHGETPLPKNYVIFGKVEDEESLKVVDAIANTGVTTSATGERSQPLENIIVQSIKIL